MQQGFCFSDTRADQSTSDPPDLLTEMMAMSHKKDIGQEENQEKMQQNLSNFQFQISSPQNQIYLPGAATPALADELDPALPKSTVFINEVWFEVGSRPFNVREAFGDDAVLIHSTGQAVLTNEWGVSLQPLQHGGFYYLLHPFPQPALSTPDLV